MDALIQATTILFILSIITEKIASFIKAYWPKLGVKTKSKTLEKLREKNIQNVAILVGIVIALSCKANIFEIYKKDFTLNWEGFEFYRGKSMLLFSVIMGSILSGIFLSSGSKFFHDLLDLLLQTKNLRRKLNERPDWDFDSISQVDEYINSIGREALEASLDVHKKALMQIDGVIKVYLSDVEGEYCLVVVTRNEGILIPKWQSYMLPNGREKKIRIIHEIGEEVIVQDASIWPASQIANAEPVNNGWGSLGCVVRRKDQPEDKLLLTCYHVVRALQHSWSSFTKEGKETVVHPLAGTIDIGEIESAIRDELLDVAVIKPNLEHTYLTEIPNLGIPTASRPLEYSDELYKTEVRMVGRKSGPRVRIGNIVKIDIPVQIKYGAGDYWILNNLVAIKSIDNKPFSRPGDSGSLIIDASNYAVGVLVAGDSTWSYAIPVDTIFNRLNLKF